MRQIHYFLFVKLIFLLSCKQLLVYQFLFASSLFNPKNYFTKLMSCCKKTWWKMVVFPWHLGVRGKLKYIERCLNGYLFLLCTFLNQIKNFSLSHACYLNPLLNTVHKARILRNKTLKKRFWPSKSGFEIYNKWV